jgi:hypothetical protein
LHIGEKVAALHSFASKSRVTLGAKAVPPAVAGGSMMSMRNPLLILNPDGYPPATPGGTDFAPSAIQGF